MNQKKPKPRQNKYHYWRKLKDLGYNYNFKTVSSKTLKLKLQEIESNNQ